MLAVTAARAMESGSIIGSIRNAETGEVVPDVVLTALSPRLETEHIAVSGADGAFVLSSLPAGMYALRFHQEGYRPSIRSDIPLRSGAMVRVTVALAPAAEDNGILSSDCYGLRQDQCASIPLPRDGYERLLPLGPPLGTVGGHALQAVPDAPTAGLDGPLPGDRTHVVQLFGARESTRLLLSLDVFNLFDHRPPLARDSLYAQVEARPLDMADCGGIPCTVESLPRLRDASGAPVAAGQLPGGWSVQASSA